MRDYPTFCQSCVYARHPVMLTGYVLPDHPCDNCGRNDRCAIVRLRRPEDPQ